MSLELFTFDFPKQNYHSSVSNNNMDYGYYFFHYLLLGAGNIQNFRIKVVARL